MALVRRRDRFCVVFSELVARCNKKSGSLERAAFQAFVLLHRQRNYFSTENLWTVTSWKVSPGSSVVVGKPSWLGVSG